MVSVSLTLIGFMMWTEYLVFRAGRVVFAPAAVAAAAILPFGILHGMMRRFNRLSRETDLDGDEEFEEDLDEEVDADDLGGDVAT